MEEIKHAKCSGCKCWRIDSSFLNDKGRRLKTCSVCRDKFKCPDCDYKTGNKGHLQTHIKTVHLKERNFECPDCDYKTGRKGDLNTHIKLVHLKEQNYQCSECDQKFGLNGHLQKHIKTVHLKERNFECPECDKKFGTNSTLQRHISTVHLKERNFECPDCDYKAGDKGHLQKHIKTVHLKERNFECPECDKKFGTNSDLQRHIKTVHLKEKNFECPDCDYKCGGNGSLQTHIKTCTGEMNCSSGEYAIMKVLEDMNIEYEYNSTYEVKSKGLLRWDFIIDFDDNKLFIEYNGRQHYEPQRFGGMSQEKANEAFEKQQEHDKIKDDFCKENNHPLLWISYKDYGSINKLVADFIIENTSWSDF